MDYGFKPMIVQYHYCVNINLSDFDNYTVVKEEQSLVPRKYILNIQG